MKLIIVVIISLISYTSFSQRICRSTFNSQEVMNTNNERYIQFQKFQEQLQIYKSNNSNAQARLVDIDGIIVIPVVVHLIHFGEPLGTGFSITDAVIQSQIDALNEDFQRLNPTRVNTPTAFQGVVGNPKIQFRLACQDPNGNPSNGIVRTLTTKPYFINPYEDIKSTLTGGDDPWNTSKYLNIWVSQLSYGEIGYSTFPWDKSSKPNLDGVVIDTRTFGRIGNILNSSYNLGSTATHEIGHWLGLIHIWGDDGDDCTGSDFCDDTPNQGNYNFGCPDFPKTSCQNQPNGDMFMNYMDYVDDRCYNLFTSDQVTRIRSQFSNGGIRESLVINNFFINDIPSAICSNYTLSINNPSCLPIIWSLVGNAASITPNGNSALISRNINAIGIISINATAGNYTDTKEITVGPPPTNFTIVGQQHSLINQPTVWGFVAPPMPGVSYEWYKGSCSNNVFPYNCTPSVWSRLTNTGQANTFEPLLPCRIQYAIACKMSNACGASNISNFVSTSIGYCPPKRGTRFDPFVSILQHDQLKVNTANTNNWLAQLFFDEATIANEMIQRVHIYNKRGELMMEDNELNTKNATIDIAALPQDSYVIEVGGLNGYKELHTFHRSLLNQEQYQIEDIATGNIAMNVDFAEERLYVMQQKLFVELQSEPEIMNASPTLQEFASTNANSSLGIIYQIEYALGNNNVDEATTLLDHWQTTNDIDNNFKNYYALYLKVIQGGTLNTDEVATLYNIAQSCPLVAGEIVYAARSLHNNLVNDNDDYANACGYIGAKYTTKPTKLNQYLNAETSISPNPTKGIITIKLPAKDTGFKTIKITDAYGKIIAERKTFDRVLMMDVKAPTGIYFVNITNTVTGKTETQKLIINN